jgi:hypothetical protein
MRSRALNFFDTREVASTFSPDPMLVCCSTHGSLRHQRPRRGVSLAIMAMTIGLTACAGNPALVPVFASRADWEILAGHWKGSYTSRTPRRRGLIDFALSAADQQAFGDVLMIAEGTRVPYRPYPPGDPRLARIDAANTQVLTIKFVRAEQGQISGTIASYWDPDRDCQATATFLGTVQARVIDGTFTSVCQDGPADPRQVAGDTRVCEFSLNSARW